ncbi:MAG TPA: HAD-IA family hydrolase, partial [Thermoanaerobaculia bacterium]|nr:HAD-IA family hydrolase [Thermoanaerobaculia bacterium]
MSKYKIITFDCYGTLVDWRGGIRRAFESAGVDGDAALRKYMQLEPEIEQGYRPYRDILREVGKRIAAGVRLDESLPSWKPFADTIPALQRLRASGIRLGILSNVDDDL